MRPLTEKEKVALRAHFQNGVPIERLNIDVRTKDIFARAEAAYFMWLQDPEVEIHKTLYQMNRLINEARSNASKAARRQELLIEWVIDNIPVLHPSFEIKPVKRKPKKESKPEPKLEPKPKPKCKVEAKVSKPGNIPKPYIEEVEPVRGPYIKRVQSFSINIPVNPDVFTLVVQDCIRPWWLEYLSGIAETRFLSWRFSGSRFLTQESASDIVRALHLARHKLLHTDLYSIRHSDAVRQLTYIDDNYLDLTAVAHHFIDQYFPSFNPTSRFSINHYNLHLSDIEIAIHRQLPAYINSLTRALVQKYGIEAT